MLSIPPGPTKDLLIGGTYHATLWTWGEGVFCWYSLCIYKLGGLSCQQGEIMSCKFSPNGSSLASAGHDRLICKCSVFVHTWSYFMCVKLMTHTCLSRFVECVWRLRQLCSDERALGCYYGTPVFYRWKVGAFDLREGATRNQVSQ